MKRVPALVVLTSILCGCAEWAESMRRAEAERQERIQQCAAQGYVMYSNQCMSPQDARDAQQRDFIADQAARDRLAMLQAACISRGGVWQVYTSNCLGGSNDVNVNVRHY